MFLNIELRLGNMTPEELLSIQPDVMAKLIIHKRERLLETIPKKLELSEQEKLNAEQAAKKSKLLKENLSQKISNLNGELNGQREKLIEIFQGGIDSLDDDYVEIAKILLANDVSINEFEELLLSIPEQKLVQDIDDRNYNIRKILIATAKTTQLKSQINDELQQAKTEWNENESHRRRSESKFMKLKGSLQDSEASVEFWTKQLDGDFTQLLEDATRVAEGGPSSRQIQRRSAQKHQARR